MPLSKDKMRVRKTTDRTLVKPMSNLSKEYPAIVQALVDPVKRSKLIKIHSSLKRHNLLGEVRYGVYGSTFEIVGDLLEATNTKVV